VVVCAEMDLFGFFSLNVHIHYMSEKMIPRTLVTVIASKGGISQSGSFT